MMRRRLALSAAVVLTACSSTTVGEGPTAASTTRAPDPPAATSTTEVAATDTRPSGVRVPSADEPLTVTVIGDSVMFDAALGIEASLEATGAAVVESRAIGRVGLSVEAWPTFIDEVLADTDPELIVMMIGGWDLGTVEFEGTDVYRPMVDTAITTMTAGDRHIVWLGMPPTPPGEGLEPWRALLNEVYEEAASATPFVTYVDTNAALGEPEGTFARFLPGPGGIDVQARKVRDGRDDGHLCPGGAAILGELVFDTVAALTPLAPRGDWFPGPWSDDPRYDDPPGGCEG